MRHLSKAAALFVMAFAIGILCAVFLPVKWLIFISAAAVIGTALLIIRDK